MLWSCKCYGPANAVEGDANTHEAPLQFPPNDATLSTENEQPFVPNDSAEQDNSGTLAIVSTISPSSNGEEHSPNISAASEARAPSADSGGDIPVASTPGGRCVASNVEPGFQFPTFRRLNKYELTVVPDENSVVDDPLLRCTPYIVNVTYKGLICTACGHGINPRRASDHLRDRIMRCALN